MTKNDEIRFTILEDGSVKWETDEISPANHATAERATAGIAKLLGGQSSQVRKRHGHTHSHTHEHDSAGH